MSVRAWGVTEAETRLRYGCDDLVPAPVLELWRGVTVETPAEALWPWVGQVRLAPYSYDWIDNLGRRSPRELRGLPAPAVGDRFAGSGRIVTVSPGEELTAQLGRAGGPVGRTLMSYRLVPSAAGTRLLLKVAVEAGGPLTRLLLAVLPVGDLVMARKQLLTLKALCEKDSQSSRRSSLA